MKRISKLRTTLHHYHPGRSEGSDIHQPAIPPIVPSRLAILILALLLIAGMAFTQSPDRTKPPALGPAPELHVPPIQHFQLSNGVRVILVEKHDLPLVQMELLVSGGAVDDPEGKAGLAGMMAAVMEDGAGSRDALAYADAVDFLGADVSSFAGQHTCGVTLHCTVPKLDSALTLFADMVLRPQFPPAELERTRKERLTALQQWHSEPRSIMSVIFNKTLFGADHPYGRVSVGTEKSIRSFTPEDLRGFHTRIFTPDRSTLVCVGDITKKMIVPKLEECFGGWKPVQGAGGTKFQDAPQVQGRRIIIVDKPGAPQSEIRIGRIGVPRNTPDYYALEVLNTILGGSFTSRLNQNLREAHGYTYGAASRFEFRLHAGPFLAAAAVQTQVTDSALFQFMKELRDIRQPVSDAELARARNYLTLGYPGNFASVGSIAGQLADLAIFGLPDDYFNSYINRIQQVSVEDVRRVAEQYIDPENIDIIIVGDRATIGEKVAALNLGPVTNMTIDEVLGPAPVLQDGK